ncbi:hypothetical protein TetV_638 [Tetraselmis virus 1]|uniref:Uncharacterized protein n=1 Tax=Tetraselmis virus 1 TaxID=2060617 RepID=A0A2P0VPA7_9VIRU|nr:hypothetical protein QJ968_gp416 [Tetraselmis virus 1]AUF82720.1 hypothetical protein TetV_638 [Tetraselmis virus 1]
MPNVNRKQTCSVCLENRRCRTKCCQPICTDCSIKCFGFCPICQSLDIKFELSKLEESFDIIASAPNNVSFKYQTMILINQLATEDCGAIASLLTKVYNRLQGVDCSRMADITDVIIDNMDMMHIEGNSNDAVE